MTLTSPSCPVCGAKVTGARTPQNFTCQFCAFERRAAPDTGIRSLSTLEKSFEDIPRIVKIDQISEIFVEGVLDADLVNANKKYPVKLRPLCRESIKLECIWSDMTLPFTYDLTEYFSEKFHQLRPGGLLYLSTPVKRPFQMTPALPGQINFFRAKNIMFLLEQRGFKMVWRKNRFAPTLRIIARKD